MKEAILVFLICEAKEYRVFNVIRSACGKKFWDVCVVAEKGIMHPDLAMRAQSSVGLQELKEESVFGA